MKAVTDGTGVWVEEKGIFKTSRGIFRLENIPEGFFVFEAFPWDLIRKKLKRGPQIMHPRDIGTLVALTGIGSGWKVAEGGSGTGLLTIFLARIVGPSGKVFSYDVREDFMKIAKENAKLFNLENIEFKNKNIYDIDEKELDLVVFDTPDPWKGLEAAFNALKLGGYLACYLPTVNQVVKLLKENKRFSVVAVTRTFWEFWKKTPETFRPENKALQHTAFLVTFRKLSQ